jgi:signal peptidase I
MFPTFSGQGDVVIVEAVSRWLGKISPGESPNDITQTTLPAPVRCIQRVLLTLFHTYHVLSVVIFLSSSYDLAHIIMQVML